MNPYKLDINGTVITVTSTATSLLDLINTAIVAGGGNAVELDTVANGIDFVVEANDVRYMYDNTPTTTKGLLVKEKNILSLRNVDFRRHYFIATGSNATISLLAGESAVGESSSQGCYS